MPESCGHFDMKRKRIQTISSVLIFLMMVSTFHAETKSRKAPSEHDVQAAYLFNFLRFIRWPETTFPDSLEPVIIGIVGESPIVNRLEKLAEKQSLYTRPLRIRYFKKIDDIYDCHVLYIGSMEKRYQISILNKLDKSSTLTLSDSSNFCDIGGMINFILIDDRVAFRVNLKALKKANLDISAKILRLAASIIQ